MIRSHILLAAAAAVLASPVAASAADADPAFDAFRSLCAANVADYLTVLKAADADGWKETKVYPPTDNAISVTDQAAREKTIDGDDLTLFINRGLQHMKSGDIPEATCRIETSKPHPGAIDLSKSWVGAPPDGGDATLAIYFVKPGGDKIEHIPVAVLNQGMPAGGVSIIKVQQDPATAIFVYQLLK